MDKESITLFASLSSGLATIVLAYLTWRYVKLTHEMVNEIKKARNPIVTINFFKAMQGHSMTRIYMIISNIGLSPAKDINLRAECKAQVYQTEIVKGKPETKILKLNDLDIFKNGIPYLSPGPGLTFKIGEFQNTDIQKSPFVNINYDYKTENSETIYRNIMLDLRYLPEEEQ